jgi:hypothetical protein
MKYVITLTIALASVFAFAAETQKVCIDKITKDGKPVLDKAGKPTQECKMMKVHKKLEGTAVPSK